MRYPGLHPSLEDFVSEIEFVTKSTSENKDPIEFRNIMARRASKLVLKRPKNLTVTEKRFETGYGGVDTRIYRSKSS